MYSYIRDYEHLSRLKNASGIRKGETVRSMLPDEWNGILSSRDSERPEHVTDRPLKDENAQIHSTTISFSSLIRRLNTQKRVWLKKYACNDKDL